MNEKIEEKLQNLPASPGVYLMKDEAGKVIYVGKALSLKSRVRSYFNEQGGHSEKTRALVRHIRDLEWILTDSEVEALILECNLIKKYKPKYNIRLMDDKSYPYLKITLQEEYPRLELVRSMGQDGARYFGPYTSTGAVNETLKLLRQVFPLRTCKSTALWGKMTRPCLNAHIGRCMAPCMGKADAGAYKEMIREVILFLEGKQESLCKVLEARMQEAAEALEFEKAAQLRDQLLAMEKVSEKQKIVSEKQDTYDVINYARGSRKVCVQVFFVREGKLQGRESFFMEGIQGEEDVLTPFLRQYYSRVQHIPAEIYVPAPETGEEEGVTEAWLTQLRGRKVQVKVPKRGDRRELMAMVGKNARDLLLQNERQQDQQGDRTRQGLEELQRVLGLAEVPHRMECYDISHISGTETVASMVVSVDGKVRPDLYRRFKIRMVEGNNDFASMAEVILRRFGKERMADERFGWLPDLVVIDGGVGQLNAACSILEVAGLASIPTVGLAKQFDWIYQPNQPDPVVLGHKSPGLQLLQQLRDEAHRFAITYHRLLRGKRNLTSALDEIPGLGPKGKKALLQQFDLSLKAIMNASLEELEQTAGISRKAAAAVYDWFHPADPEPIRAEEAPEQGVQ
jgi:excinuclease ABC subunit C